MRAQLTNDSRQEFDITEHVKLIFDLVTASMDWGSGFLDTEEMIKVLELGIFAGFDVSDITGEKRFYRPTPELIELGKAAKRIRALYDLEGVH